MTEETSPNGERWLELGAWSIGLEKEAGSDHDALGCFAKEFNILLKAMGSLEGFLK